MTRIELPTRETLPTEELRSRWDRLESRGGLLNIHRVFMANPGIELNALKVWTASGLSPRSRELLILRCAFLKQSTYEWHQHVRIARDAGLSDSDIKGVRDWKTAGLAPGEQSLLAYVDAIGANSVVSDQQFAAFAEGRSQAEIVGITFLITLYFNLAQVMAVLQLDTEDPFVGWDLAGAR
jgi:alkylhydroperoxidase family enzyme